MDIILTLALLITLILAALFIVSKTKENLKHNQETVAESLELRKQELEVQKQILEELKMIRHSK